MKAISYAILALFATFAMGSPVDEARFINYCQAHLPQESITLSTELASEKVVDSLPAVEIAKSINSPHGYGALGYLEKKQQLRTTFNSALLQYPGQNLYCARIQAHIRVINVEHTIYLAKELAADDCAYKAVLAHEREHALNAANQLNRLIERFTSKPVNGRNSVIIGTREQIESVMKGFVARNYEEQLLEELKHPSAEDLHLDAADYEKNHRLCGGHLQMVGKMSKENF